MKKNLTYIGHQHVDDWKVRVIEKDKDKFVYRILYPFISGWLSKEKQEVKTEFVRSIFTYVTSRAPKSGKFVIAK